MGMPLLASLTALACATTSGLAQQTEGSVELAPNRVVRLEQGDAQQLIPVFVRNLMRSEVLDVSLKVLIGGRDVTIAVSPAHETPLDLLSRTNRSGTMYRLDLFTIDLSALSLRPGQQIDYRASVTGPGFELFDTAMATVVAAEPPNEGVVAGVSAFVQELGADMEDSGKVRFKPDLSGDDLETAEQNLRSCLAQCTPPVYTIDNKTFACTDINGDTLIVRVDLEKDGGGDDAHANGVSGAGGPDVVIAIGGDAAPSSNDSGGAAKATVHKSGAASLAIGGNGGGDANNPGNGGAATASSTDPAGGDSYGAGGGGGNGQDSGGDGGHASGATGCPNATGFGQGGDGGDPIDHGKICGKGGNGTGSRHPGTVTGYGAGQPGGKSIGTGEHGEGGWGRSNLGSPGINHGSALPNT